MGNQVNMYKYGNDTDTFVQSLSLQLADCQMVGHNIHYAAVASCAAKSAGYKTQKEHKQHLRVHKQANIVKHNLFELEKFRSSLPQLPPLPPPPPPQLPELDCAIQCSHLEVFRGELYCASPTMACGITGTSKGSIVIDEASMVFTVGETDLIDSGVSDRVESPFLEWPFPPLQKQSLGIECGVGQAQCSKGVAAL